MFEFTHNVIKMIYNFAKSKLENSYTLIKVEGFSSGFTKSLIAFTSIAAIAFGTVGLLALISYLDNVGYTMLEPVHKLARILASILYAKNIGDLMVRSFIVFNLPVVILIVVQKIITRNLIKKYRDKESNLIKP